MSLQYEPLDAIRVRARGRGRIFTASRYDCQVWVDSKRSRGNVFLTGIGQQLSFAHFQRFAQAPL